jgi:hypothetical protein
MRCTVYRSSGRQAADAPIHTSSSRCRTKPFCDDWTRHSLQADYPAIPIRMHMKDFDLDLQRMAC